MATPPYAVPIADGWSLWKWVELRSAGFPARWADRLACSEAVARRLDEVNALIDQKEQARRALVAVGKAALESARGKEREPWKKLLKPLWNDQLPERAPAGHSAAEGALETLRDVQRRLDGAREGARADFGADRRAITLKLLELSADGRFREALAWQNRKFLKTGLDSLVRHAGSAGAAAGAARRYEWTLGRYVQRYCLKNDTIGFFGPDGWALLAPEGPAVAFTPRSPIVEQRFVAFEHWAIDTLARRLAEMPGMQRWMRPRRHPSVRFGGDSAELPSGESVSVAPATAELLAAIDAERTAHAIAEQLLSSRAFESEAQVLGELEALRARGLITWALEVPTESLHPERELARMLELIADEPLRSEALQKLRQLDDARLAVQRAAGDAEEVDRAIARLESTFTELTGSLAERHGGQTYAGRTLVYEDCRRSMELRFGPAFADRVGAPLSLLLQSARWFTHVIAQRYRAALTQIHGQMKRAGGGRPVSFVSFMGQANRLFKEPTGFGSNEEFIIAQVSEELRARWGAVLALDLDERAVARSSEALRSAVASSFSAPAPGWPSARFHSPDVMVAARSVSDFARGQFTAVLGELHAALNSVSNPSSLETSPFADDIIRAREADIPHIAPKPVITRDRQGISRAHWSLSAQDVHVEFSDTRSNRARSHVVAVSELWLDDEAGPLCVRTRDGKWRFDLIGFFDHHLAASCFSYFHLMPAAPHSPRVTIDGLIIARERWRFDCEDLAFKELDGFDQFAAVSRWAAAAGMPRRVFIKVPEEPKPTYVDFHSPLYVEMFCATLSKASTVSISEMLPGLDDLWLHDEVDQRYTAELRIAALDPVPWSPPA